MAYHYTLSGLDNIWLENGYTEHDTDYGPSISITDVDGLHLAISWDLIRKKGALLPKELRFLRKQADCSQKQLANLLCVSEQKIARAERGDQMHDVPTEAALRLLALELILNDKSEIKSILERVNSQIDEDYQQRRLIVADDKRWKLAA